MFYIYKFTNKINGKCYIGSTNNPDARRRQHLANSINECSVKYMYPLYCAFRKYGVDNFSFEVLVNNINTKEEIQTLESEFILSYNSICPNGYNQTAETFSPMRDNAIVEKLVETKREKYGKLVGLVESGEVKQTWRSLVECANELKLDRFKISAVCNGKRRTTGGMEFRFIEDGLILEPIYNPISQSHRDGVEVYQLDKNTGEILNKYPSMELARVAVGGSSSSNIAAVCNGRRKSAFGYGWKKVHIDN